MIPRTSSLVTQAYDPTLACPAWREAWARAEAEQSRVTDDQIGRAEVFRIAGPHDESLLGWLAGRTDDSGTDEETTGSRGCVTVKMGSRSSSSIASPVSFACCLLGPVCRCRPRRRHLDPPPEQLALAASAATVRLPAVTRPGRARRLHHPRAGRPVRRLHRMAAIAMAGPPAGALPRRELHRDHRGLAVAL